MNRIVGFGVAWLALVLAGCGEQAAGDRGQGPDASGGDAVTVVGQVVVTLHVKGGEEKDLEYLRSQLEGFGDSQAARKDADAWRVYVLMKPGVSSQFGIEQRNMLEAYVRPPLEFLMSSWGYNENDWFALVGE